MRCRLLLSVIPAFLGLSVCHFVCQVASLCRNGWMDRFLVWVEDSSGPGNIELDAGPRLLQWWKGNSVQPWFCHLLTFYAFAIYMVTGDIIHLGHAVSDSVYLWCCPVLAGLLVLFSSYTSTGPTMDKTRTEQSLGKPSGQEKPSLQ